MRDGRPGRHPQVGRTDGWPPTRCGESQNPAYRPAHRHEASDQHIQLRLVACCPQIVLGSRSEHPVGDRRGHVTVVAPPMDVGTAHALHRVTEMAHNGRQGCALGEQCRGAEVAQRVEVEPSLVEARASECWLPRRFVELARMRDAPRTPRNSSPSLWWSRTWRRSSTATTPGSTMVRVLSAFGVVSIASFPMRCS